MANFNLKINLAQLGAKAMISKKGTPMIAIPVPTANPNAPTPYDLNFESIFISEKGNIFLDLVMSENQNKEFSDYSIKLNISKETREKLDEEQKKKLYIGNAKEIIFSPKNNVENQEIYKQEEDLPF